MGEVVEGEKEEEEGRKSQIQIQKWFIKYQVCNDKGITHNRNNCNRNVPNDRASKCIRQNPSEL